MHVGLCGHFSTMLAYTLAPDIFLEVKSLHIVASQSQLQTLLESPSALRTLYPFVRACSNHWVPSIPCVSCRTHECCFRLTWCLFNTALLLLHHVTLQLSPVFQGLQIRLPGDILHDRNLHAEVCEEGSQNLHLGGSERNDESSIEAWWNVAKSHPVLWKSFEAEISHKVVLN